MPTINFAGIASGIDSNSLIDAISKSTRAARVTPNETKATELTETNSVFEDLKTKLLKLQDLTYNFSTLGGGILSKLATSSDETTLTASASSSATNGSYEVTVSSKAKNHTYSFDQAFAGTSDSFGTFTGSSPNDDLTFVIGEGSFEKTITLTLDSGATLSSVVAAFNAKVDELAPGYATASVINVGTSAVPSYRMVVNTNNQGTEKGSITSVTTGGNLLVSTASSSESVATNAIFEMTGVTGTITRSSNAISDVIAGLTFNIQSSSGTATITVEDDVAKTQATIQEFVDTYNEIVLFINENNEIRREEDGEDVQNIFSPLSKSRTDDNFLTTFRNAMSLSRNQNVTNNVNIAVNTLADLGFQTNRDGTIEFITDDIIQPSFKKAMAADSSLVNSILTRLGDLVGTTAGIPSLLNGGGVIAQYVRANGLIDTSVTGNKTLITNLNDRIAQAEALIARQEEQLRARFARLESLTGKLQGQQQALTSALAGLGGG